MTGSAGENHFRVKLSDGKTEALASIIRQRIASARPRTLAVGCGSGLEAAILAQELEATVTGIDSQASFDPIAAERIELRRGDATCLDMASG